MPPEAILVARKELLEIARDRRSLLVLFLLPVVLYPLLLIGATLVTTAQLQRLAGERLTVWVDDPAAVPPALEEALSAPPPEGRALDLIGGGPWLQLVLQPLPPDVDLDQALSEGRAVAVLRGLKAARAALAAGQNPAVELLYNGGVDTSRFACAQLELAVEAWSRAEAERRLAVAGLPAETLHPVASSSEDRGRPGAALGRVLASLLVVLALTGAFYPALDLGAGEKERGTLETLLLAPVPRVSLALGKWLAVFVVALVGACLHLLSLTISFASFGLVAPAMLPLSIELRLVPLTLLVLLPLVALFSALALAVSTFAASYKEGNAYLTPLVIAATVPVMVAAFPGVTLSPVLCMIPVCGAALLVKELFAGTAHAWQVGLVAGSTLAYALLAVRWVAALYGEEEVLWRPAAAAAPDLLGLRRSGRPSDGRPTLPQGVALGIGVLLFLWFGGVPLQARAPVAGLAATLLGVAGLAVGYALLLRCDLRRTFAWRAPPPRLLLAAPLLAVFLLELNLELLPWLDAWRGPLDGSSRRQLEEQLAPLLQLGPGARLALMALLPAVCEELCFRGFVLQGLLSQGGRLAAVLVSALLFGMAHLDPARLLPTALVGVAAGGLVLRGGSLLPAVVLHALHNGLLLALSDPELLGSLAGALLPGGRPGLALRAGALAAGVVGVLLAARATAVPAREGGSQ